MEYINVVAAITKYKYLNTWLLPVAWNHGSLHSRSSPKSNEQTGRWFRWGVCEKLELYVETETIFHPSWNTLSVWEHDYQVYWFDSTGLTCSQLWFIVMPFTSIVPIFFRLVACLFVHLLTIFHCYIDVQILGTGWLSGFFSSLYSF